MRSLGTAVIAPWLPRSKPTVWATVVILATVMLGQTVGKRIKVLSGSERNNVISLRAERDGKPIDMLCYKSVPECTNAQPGDDVMEEAPEGTQAYNDCLNVYLYSEEAKKRSAKKIGVYCLLQP